MEKTMEKFYQEARQNSLTGKEYLQTILANYTVGMDIRTSEQHDAEGSYKYDALHVEVGFDKGEVRYTYFAAFDLTEGHFKHGYCLFWNTENNKTIRYDMY